MAILAECPVCHKKQKTKNKLCKCGEDLDKAKKSKRVRYWINFRMPDGSQCRQAVGSFEGLDPFSIEDARDADSKRKVQKRENRIFDIKAECRMTFNQLTKWYLSLEKIKALSYYWVIENCLNKFNSELGNKLVSDIKPVDLENLQAKRTAEGKADSTIDQEIGAARTMINKAFDNDMVSGDIIKTFKKVKKLLKRNANARKKVLTPDQFNRLLSALPFHAKGIIATAFYTGMRKGEIVNLTWDKVFLPNRVIQLEATDTKDREPRLIPICDGLYAILKGIPRAIHDNHVFLYNGKPVKDIRGTLTQACEKAKIPYGRFQKDGFVTHDLRHTFNTNMRKAGVQESVIMEITGHSTREMFDRYNTIDADDAKEAIRKLEGFLQSEKSNVDQNVDQASL
jgi:integrase